MSCETVEQVQARWNRGGFVEQDFTDLQAAKPWERMAHESSQRFDVFALWLRTPARERSTHRLAREIVQPLELIEAWRSTGQWDFRAECYDRFCEHLWHKEKNSALRTQIGNEVELITMARRRAALLGFRIFDRALKKEEDTPQGATELPFSVTEAIKTLEYVRSVEAVGASHENENLNFDTFTDDELLTYRKLRAKAAGGT
jgi:hypothetical protein